MNMNMNKKKPLLGLDGVMEFIFYAHFALFSFVFSSGMTNKI